VPPIPEQDEFESAFAAITAEKTPAVDPVAPATFEPSPPADIGTAAAEPAAPLPEAEGKTPEVQPDLAARLKEIEQRALSSEGRLSAFSRQAQEAEARALAAERKLAELQARPAAPPPETTPSEEEDDILKQSPELKAAIERRVNQALTPVQTALDKANARLARIDETATTAARHVEPLVARQAQQEMDAVHRRLDEAFPAWRDTVKSGDFKAWLTAQPKQVKQLYEEGASFDEAAVVLKLFNAGKPSAATPSPAAGTSAPPSRTTIINPDRVRAAAGIRSTSPPSPAAIPEDFEGAFAAFARQLAGR
jgi:hypothetical protein